MAAADEDDDGHATVTVNGRAFVLDRSADLMVGRVNYHDVVGVGHDPADTAVSRVHARVRWAAGTWWLDNLSGSRPVYVEYEALADVQTLPPGNSTPVWGRLRVVIRGRQRAHEVPVAIGAGPPAEAVDVHVPHAPQTTPLWRGYTEHDLDALTALFAGYLERFPRYHPVPDTHVRAARRIGATTRSVERRIAKIRERLRERGELLAEGPDANDQLARHLIAHGIIGPADLDRLDRLDRADRDGAADEEAGD